MTLKVHHLRPAPGANEEYLLYQTLDGTWPFEEGDDALLRLRLNDL